MRSGISLFLFLAVTCVIGCPAPETGPGENVGKYRLPVKVAVAEVRKGRVQTLREYESGKWLKALCKPGLVEKVIFIPSILDPQGNGIHGLCKVAVQMDADFLLYYEVKTETNTIGKRSSSQLGTGIIRADCRATVEAALFDTASEKVLLTAQGDEESKFMGAGSVSASSLEKVVVAPALQKVRPQITDGLFKLLSDN